MMPDYFKPMLEGNESVLRPQRNSFQSGCKVRTTNAAETNEKSGGPVKGPGSHRRVSESKDRCVGAIGIYLVMCGYITGH